MLNKQIKKDATGLKYTVKGKEIVKLDSRVINHLLTVNRVKPVCKTFLGKEI